MLNSTSFSMTASTAAKAASDCKMSHGRPEVMPAGSFQAWMSTSTWLAASCMKM